ncbi:hypothetical protein [Erwinia billingiae]|uniref:hypothetical protein n=1 Tax=Erwinia billingiae TaxID=182337 RepID=UPI003207E3E7
MSNKDTKINWWEKTVEYNFVLAAKDEFGLNMLAPFDGNPESIGDAVVGSNSKFFIIEFKRTLSDFKSEITKYVDGDDSLEEAKNTLTKLEACKYHYIIAGGYKDGDNNLTLNIRRYFKVDEILDIKPRDFFKDGMTRDQLNYYTELFTNFKNRNESDDSSGSNSGGLSHSYVLAVDENRKATTLSVNYYLKLRLEKKKGLTFGG